MAEAAETKTERAMRVARAAREAASKAVAPGPVNGAGPIPAAWREITPQPEQDANESKPAGSSPKSKASRGVDPSVKTVWVDANFAPAEHERMLKVAKRRGVKLSALLAGLIAEQLEEMEEEMGADVKDYDEAQRAAPTSAEAKLTARLEKMSADELQAYADAELKKYNDMVAEIARRKNG